MKSFKVNILDLQFIITILVVVALSVGYFIGIFSLIFTK